MQQEGHTPQLLPWRATGSVVDFWSFRQFPVDGQPEVERVEYTKKREVVHIWTKDTGYEITYKGKITLPELQVKTTSAATPTRSKRSSTLAETARSDRPG